MRGLGLTMQGTVPHTLPPGEPKALPLHPSPTGPCALLVAATDEGETPRLTVVSL